MKQCIFILIVLMGLTTGAKAQEDFRCITPEMNRTELENNPEARARRAQLEQFIDNYEEPAGQQREVYVIPVVFHIVHDNGSENIPYEQVEDAIRILNEDYRLINSDTTYIIDEFKQLATDSQIEFRLAKIDPSGNCTNGVTRTESHLTTNGGESIKDIAPGWPRASYMNVWVVRSIGNSVAGYAYYPGTVEDGRDGIVIGHTYVGSIGTGSTGGSRTLTHEVGHWLNLAHPWGHSNDPELASNCDIDDGIDDTPNTIGHTSCNLYANTCGSLDNVQNYMDYSFCGRMYTHGQGEAMRAVLNSPVADRDNLSTEANLIATGTLNPEEAEICAASADFSFDMSHGCEGISVQFTDRTYGTDSISTYNWSFQGGTPSSSQERHPVVTYDNEGFYDVELEVINPAGNDIYNVEKAISVYQPASGNTFPFHDSFESSDFPEGSGPGDDHYFETYGETGWQRSTNAATSGDHAMFIDLNNEPDKVKNAFITPAIQVDSLDFPLNVDFQMAYAQSQENNMDILKVYISADCGENWLIRYYKNGENLNTANTTHAYGTFYPQEDEWREENFSLSESMFDDPNSIRLKFEAESRGGNAMYIDDINLTSVSGFDKPSVQNNFSLYPTFFNKSLYLESEVYGKAVLSAYDISGKLLSKTNIKLTDQQNIAGYIPENHTGLVIIKIKTQNSVKVFKAIAAD
ncbi:MAG: M43 family zinc metalloprotease [Bacteroidota bacterium]